MPLRKLVLIVAVGLALSSVAPSCRASMAGGQGAGQPCTGSQPWPCAVSDTAPRPYSTSVPAMSPTGNVGVPFVNDFGEREVRLTDANSVCGGSSPPNYSFVAGSSAEDRTISLFDPNLFGGDGGYHILVNNIGGAWCVVDVDSKTFAQVDQIDGRGGRYPHGFKRGFNSTGNPTFCTNGYQSGCQWSTVSPTLMYATNHTTQIVKYDLADDSAGIHRVYDFAGCPNLPAVAGTYITEFQVRGAGDRYFMLVWGGKQQGAPTQVAVYDAKNGSCFWYNTQYSTVGGTGITTTTTGVPLLGVPSLPASNVATDCNGAAGSALADGTYYVAVTASSMLLVNEALGQTMGETTPSGIVSAVVSCGGSNSGRIIVASPPAPANPYGLQVKGYNVYIGAADDASALHLQSPGVVNVSAAISSPTFGTTYTQSTPISSKRQSPPTVNGAGFAIHNAQFAPDGSYVRIDYQPLDTPVLVWKPESNPTAPFGCVVSHYCGQGHFVNGYGHLVNQAYGSNNDLGYGRRPLAGVTGHRVPNPPSIAGYIASDSHISWNYNDPKDTTPFIVTNFASYTRSGDGTQGWSNPASKSTSAFDREVYALSPTTGKTWRFAHTRASYLANPTNNPSFWNQMQAVESEDGKLVVFGSNWGWYLGTNRGSSASCPAPGSFCRVDLFAVELK